MASRPYRMWATEGRGQVERRFESEQSAIGALVATMKDKPAGFRGGVTYEPRGKFEHAVVVARRTPAFGLAITYVGRKRDER